MRLFLDTPTIQCCKKVWADAPLLFLCLWPCGGFDWLESVPCGVRIPGSWTIQSLPYQADALTGIALFGIGPTTKQTAIHELELRSSYVLLVEHG